MLKAVLAGTALTVAGFFFMNNCAQPIPGSGGSTRGGTTPPTTNPPPSSLKGGGSYFYPSTSSENQITDDEDNVFYKSSDVVDYEQELGTSAPLIKEKIIRSGFRELRCGDPINDMDEIEELRLYVKLEKIDDTNPVQYGGTVSIRYKEDGTDRGVVLDFNNGPGNLKKNTRQNIWRKVGSQNVFYAVFQETDSTLAIVIDRVTPSACEQNTDCDYVVYGGSVWVRTFRLNADTTGHARQSYICKLKQNNVPRVLPPFPSEKPCWRIKRGPYDCRPNWQSSENTFHPTRKFHKVGDFEGLNLKEAFRVDGNVEEIFKK